MLPKWTKPAAPVALALGVALLFSAYPEGWKAGRVQAAATAPPLGSAGSYAVLAAAGVTNTGGTVLTGDLGTHPTPAITGFFGTTANEGPGVVNPPGTIHQADAAALAARTALTAAYNNAFGQPTDFAIGTELGGLTLAPGVYASPTFGITAGAGALTLNGSATDVWIFKADATLITSASSTVMLSGGAQACNVYWQVGSSATLGANSTFRGTILANTTISAGNGASVQGRLLAGAVAGSGAVTLDNNTITISLCAQPPATATATPTPTATAAPATATATATGIPATPTATATLAPATATAVAATATSIAATATAVAPTAAAASATSVAATATAVAPTAAAATATSIAATATAVAPTATPVVPPALPKAGDNSSPGAGPFALLLGALLLAAGLAFRRTRA